MSPLSDPTTPPNPPTPPSDEQVRRLLAEARHDEPMPDDVADRLDRVLADLAPRAPGAPAGAPPTPAVRRRRIRRALVLAAAAAVVAGVGLTQVDLDQGGSDASSGAADSAAVEEHAGSTGKRPRLDPDRFPAQVAALARAGRLSAPEPAGPPAQPQASKDAPTTGRTDIQSAPLSRGCTGAGWGPGQRVAVRYDGAPAVLVVRKPRGDTQRVDLYLCDSVAPVRSTVVPAG